MNDKEPPDPKAYWEKQAEYALIALNYARQMLGKVAIEVEK